MLFIPCFVALYIWIRYQLEAFKHQVTLTVHSICSFVILQATSISMGLLYYFITVHNPSPFLILGWCLPGFVYSSFQIYYSWYRLIELICNPPEILENSSNAISDHYEQEGSGIRLYEWKEKQKKLKRYIVLWLILWGIIISTLTTLTRFFFSPLWLSYSLALWPPIIALFLFSTFAYTRRSTRNASPGYSWGMIFALILGFILMAFWIFLVVSPSKGQHLTTYQIFLFITICLFPCFLFLSILSAYILATYIYIYDFHLESNKLTVIYIYINIYII